jgi:transcriptional regulator of heat shock response
MITDRQLQLLNFIIEEYIHSAEPVGSALVCKKADFALSPATIRNEMNELEQLGFLMQPHTSAGRVPTDQAYRYYVNSLIQSGDYALDPKHRRQVDESLIKSSDDPRDLIRTIAQVLSKISEDLVITNITGRNDFYKSGLSGMMEFPEFKEFDRMFNLTSFFDQFDEMFDRIQREFFSRSGEVTIMIGRENPFGEIQDESVISARYDLPHHFTGSLTLIGPKRMDYRKNLGLVTYTVQALKQLSI